MCDDFLMLEEGTAPYTHHLPADDFLGCVFVWASFGGCRLVVAFYSSRGGSNLVGVFGAFSRPHPLIKGQDCFCSLCGCGVFNPATRLPVGVFAFWVCNVFQRLMGCGIRVFLHTPYMTPCRRGLGVDVEACID